MIERQAFFYLLIGLVAAACARSLDREEYIAWVRDYDNGLHVKKVVGEYMIDIQYQPRHYLDFLRGEMGFAGADPNDEGKDDLQYYALTLGLADGATDFIQHQVMDVTSRQQKLYYYSYSFQNDIVLEEEGQVLPCVLFHFERQVDLKPTRTFLLGFPTVAGPSEGARLVIDSPWINSLLIKIKIAKTNIPIPKEYEASLP